MEANSAFDSKTMMDNKPLPELVGKAPGGHLLTDSAGIILQADHSVAVMLHTSTRRLVGRALSSFVLLEEQIDFIRKLAEIRELGEVNEWQTVLQLRDEVTIHTGLIACAGDDENGEEIVIHWVLRDLSSSQTVYDLLLKDKQELEKRVKDQSSQLQKYRQDLLREIDQRRRAENEAVKSREELEYRIRERTQELEDSNQKLRAELEVHANTAGEAGQGYRQIGELYAVTQTLLTTLDLEPLLGKVLDSALNSVSSAEKGIIHLIARDTGMLEMRALVGYSDQRIQKIDQRTGKGYVASVVKNRQPLLIDEIKKDDLVVDTNIEISGEPEVQAAQSAIAAPMILHNDVLGVISLESSKRRAFKESDLHMLVTFAATVTIAIRNAQLHGEVQKLAITDPVTGLYNRRGFNELGRREVERARRFGRPLSVIMFDMDHFKDINDTFGHASGDVVLHLMADRIRSNVREVDIVGRYGGDEFVILLPETDLFVAINVAERIRLCVGGTPLVLDDNSIETTISLGVARMNPDQPDLSVLMERVDSAMYAAKRGGRNRVEIG